MKAHIIQYQYDKITIPVSLAITAEGAVRLAEQLWPELIDQEHTVTEGGTEDDEEYNEYS